MSASEKRSLRERLRPKERKPAVRWLLTVLLLAAAVLGLHMLLQMIGTLDFSRGRFSSYLHVPKIYLLNLLPVALLVAFTYFATNRAWLGFLIPSVLLFLMDFVNYFKVTLRGDPFVAEDFLTIGEGAGIIGQYTLHFPAMFFVGIALIARRDDRPAPLGARPCAQKALVAPRSGAGAHRAAGLRCMGALVRQYRSL